MMAKSASKNVEVTLKDVRLSFPYLFTPRVQKNDKGDTTKKFKASFLIPKSDKATIAAIDAAIDEAMEAKWGDNLPKLKDDKFCFRDGDDEDIDGYAGHMYISASNSKRPTVVDRKKKPLVEEDGVVYAGCYVNAVIRIWAQDSADYGKRVNASLEAVQYFREGEAFGAPPVDIDDKFEDYDDEESSSRSSRSRDDDDRGSRRGREDEDRGSRRSSRDDDDRGSRRGRGDDDGESRTRGSRDDDDRGSRRRRD